MLDAGDDKLFLLFFFLVERERGELLNAKGRGWKHSILSPSIHLSYIIFIYPLVHLEKIKRVIVLVIVYE